MRRSMSSLWWRDSNQQPPANPARFNVEKGLTLRRYWTNACQTCAIKDRCTEAKQRRITRWEHEHVVEAVERRLDEHPERMYIRLNTVEHPFGTIKSWMGATHFQMKTLKKVGTEMALHVLATISNGS